MTANLRVLTSLRFFAATLVFVQHVAPQTSRFSLGGAGVAFFFILSGFILTYVYADELAAKRTRESVARFYIARVARIYPIYIVGFVLSLLEVVYGADPDWTGASVALRWTQTWTELALVQSWFAQLPIHFGINSPSWTISCEALFYACFPFLVATLARATARMNARSILAVAAVAAVLPALCLLALRVPASEWVLYVFPPTRLIDFAIGILLGLAYLRPREGRQTSKPSTVECVAVCAVLASIALVPRVPETLRYVAIFLPGFAFAIYVFAAQRGVISRVLSAPAFVLLGEASFAFYLTHRTVIRTVRLAFPHLPTFEKIPIAFVAALGLSIFLFYFVERPLRVRIKAGLQGLLLEPRAARTARFDSAPDQSIIKS
jgi:peptidoglycan/LPS O-acetylase OafA/YrhL